MTFPRAIPIALRKTTLRSLLLALLLADQAQAQTPITGVLVEDRDRLPLSCVDVALLDGAGVVRARTQTSRDGSFAFAPGAASEPLALRVSAHLLAPTDLPLASFETDSASRRRYVMVLEPDAAALPARPDDSPPIPVARFIAPKYPDELRASLARGSVMVGLAVDEHGRADTNSAVVLQATHAEFLDSSLEALARARFRPARRDGRATCAFIIFSFQFAHARP